MQPGAPEDPDAGGGPRRDGVSIWVAMLQPHVITPVTVAAGVYKMVVGLPPLEGEGGRWISLVMVVGGSGGASAPMRWPVAGLPWSTVASNTGRNAQSTGDLPPAHIHAPQG